jgi:predicted transcriptional regulator YdeE
MNTEPTLAPTLTQLSPLTLVGLETRTTNTLESNPATARIGNNWQQFFARGLGQAIPNQTSPHKVFGVYTRYESDFRGEYSQLVAVSVSKAEAIADRADKPSFSKPSEARNLGLSALDLSTVLVPQARYLVFSGSGEMPQTVLHVWQQVWAYFAQSACAHQRAHTTDLEVYDSTRPNIIEILIAIR